MSSIDLQEFGRQLFQDVLAEADSAGRFVEDVFFEMFCAYLIEAGEVDTGDRADYRGPRGSGIRVDGYGGDPLEAEGTLSLIVLEFDQSDEPGRLTNTEMEAAFRRVTNFVHKALDAAWRDSLEETDPGFGLADLVATRWPDIRRIRMFLLTNRVLSERVDGRPADRFDGKAITYSVWDVVRLHRFAVAGRGKEDIEIDLEGEFGAALPLLPAHLPSDEYAAYLAVVPGPLLAEIYDRWGARLLEQNVRVFLQARSNVNRGIRRTLEQDPSMFLAYNNGITGTAQEVTTRAEDGQLSLTRMKNFQIVNGGQTTASIHAALRSKVDLSHVFVQMKLSIVDSDRAEEIVPKISEYANSQNRVNAADFFANHPFHVRMEEFSRRLYAPSPDGEFRETRWFYERARGQYQDARGLLTPSQRRRFDLEHPRSQLFTKTDLAKFDNVWRGQPHVVSLGAQKNFAQFAAYIGGAWERNQNEFNEGWFRHAVAKAIVFRSTEKLVSAQSWYEGGYRANIVAYAIAKLGHDVAALDRVVDFEVIWRRQALSDVMAEALTGVAEEVHEVLVDPPTGISNVTEWAKKQACWSRVQSIESDCASILLPELITKAEDRDAARGARRDQRVLNGIAVQKAVVEAGPAFWRELLQWGEENGSLSPKEAGVLTVATRMPAKIPTEGQSKVAFEVAQRLWQDGFPKALE
ncbi:MAG: AIPR family protein [Gammaproteobacteria bacterium]|nr:AIPR family protein [Gammaproteobacteria bacterium]